jgi:hypothetical protein
LLFDHVRVMQDCNASRCQLLNKYPDRDAGHGGAFTQIDFITLVGSYGLLNAELAYATQYPLPHEGGFRCSMVLDQFGENVRFVFREAD